MAEHTQGPWRAVRSTPNDGFDVWWIENEHGYTVTEVPGHYHREGGEAEANANARLIAAAPSMFAYIQKMAESGDEQAMQIVENINANA